jgi:hypothetical protein
MDINSGRIAVLTGAGFTRNFGGFLAKEMWERIFSHRAVQERPVLKKAMMSDPHCNYENILHDVQTGAYSDEDKEVFYSVVEEVYRLMDSIVTGYCENDRDARGISLRGVNALLKGAFSEGGGKKHYLFTLNQDLFLERAGGHRSPFVDLVGRGSMKLGSPFMPEHCVILPTEAELEERKKQHSAYGAWQYLKLHGSFGWKSPTGGRGMVMGKNKEEDIEKEPLLKLQYDIFQQVLKQGGTLLIVIGYGFGDAHINRHIVEAKEQHGLTLYVITPSDASALIQKLNGVAPDLADALAGCSLSGLKDLFPFGTDHHHIALEPIYRSWGIK